MTAAPCCDDARRRSGSRDYRHNSVSHQTAFERSLNSGCALFHWLDNGRGGGPVFASALLDHKVSGQDKMSRQVAAITQGVYSAPDRVIFKAEGLLLWLAAVLPAYEKAKNDPRLVVAVEARKSSLEKTRAMGLVKRKRTLAAKYSGHRNRRIA